MCILLQNYKSESLLVHPPINLYSLLVNETLILQNMSQHNYENINILNDFINKVKIVHPELLKMTPNSSVMSFVRNRTDKFIANTKRNMMAAQRRRENERLNKSIPLGPDSNRGGLGCLIKTPSIAASKQKVQLIQLETPPYTLTPNRASASFSQNKP